MSSRNSLQHVVSGTASNGAALGDEYFNPTTNKLYKRLAVNGTSVDFQEILVVTNGVLLGNLNVGGIITATNFFAGSLRIDAGSTMTNLIITSSTISVSTLTGALTVVGGVGIGGSVYIGSGIASSSITTGALVVTGGIGASGALFVGSPSVSSNSTSGAVVVTGGVGIGGSVYIAGSLYATTKSFFIDHPTKPGQKLKYGSLESPYHGIRLTGQAALIDGEGVVALPDYISKLALASGVNIQLTNIKHGKILWVDSVDLDHNQFTVKTKMGFFDNKEYEFYWSFTAIRKDIPELDVEST